MATTLLTTKLFIPQTSPNLVPRPRLLEKLSEGITAKLILVSAPAGFGKSTLMSEWASFIDKPVTWLSLDENDNNLRRFLSYLVVAFQQIDESIGESILSSLDATDNPPVETFLSILINEIAASDNEFIIVLDDYHLIANQTIHDGLDFFLDHLPPNAHIVISGRLDPPISLSRYRARGHMIEIRPNDLRFTESEVRTFLNDLKGLELLPEQIMAMLSRTEGWITGLQLAAISMQGREDIHEFVSAFSGSHHYIIDYLVDEVMARQTEEIQKFLCQTSILDRFSAPLCDAVMGISNSKEVLRQLGEANLFLIPLDDKRNWYRYHHLFADFLKQRLRENDPENVSELHRRASEWLEQNQLITEAINHSLVGEDYQRAAQLVENVGPEMMMQSEFDQLEKWLDAMPKELVENWPWLCIIRAWMYDRWAQFDIGENYLQHAEAALDIGDFSTSSDEENIIRGQVSAIRALYTLKKGEIPQSIEHSKQALDYLPEGYFNRGVASFSLGWAKQVQGDLSGAILEFQEGGRMSLAAGNQILAQVIILDIGKIQFLQGHLHQAAETMREAIQFKYEKSEIKIPYASSANIGLADILREWNELGAALSYLQEGIEIGTTSKILDAIAAGYASIALVHLAQGNLDEALQACEKAERMLRDNPDLEPDTKTKIMGSRVWLLLAQNKLTEAARYVQERGLSVDAEINYFTEFKHIILARVLIYNGRENSTEQELTDAHNILAQILKLAKQAGYKSQMIEALVLQAAAFDAQGNQEQALNSIKAALSLAEPEGYIRTYVDEGESMKELLLHVASKGNIGEYVGKLISAFDKRDFSKRLQTSQPLIDPLSERELDVLKLLATELSGPEIAQELMVSLNTMRTHTKNIYVKLGVNKRRAAVRQAEELKLI